MLLVVGLLAGCVTVQEKEAFEMRPMYGQPDLVRDPYLVSEDSAFKKATLKRYQGDHQAASRYYSKKAHEYFSYGQIQKSMEYFNRAWLLDDENAQAYWGFGQVLVIRNQLDEAIRHLEKAKSIGVVTFQRPALLVDVGIAYSIQAERAIQVGSKRGQRLFAKANQNFQESSLLEPTYGEVWRRWAFSLVREQRYEEAWGAVKKARSLGVKKFPPSFLKLLGEALPEPS